MFNTNKPDRVVSAVGLLLLDETTEAKTKPSRPLGTVVVLSWAMGE